MVSKQTGGHRFEASFSRGALGPGKKARNTGAKQEIHGPQQSSADSGKRENNTEGWLSERAYFVKGSLNWAGL